MILILILILKFAQCLNKISDHNHSEKSSCFSVAMLFSYAECKLIYGNSSPEVFRKIHKINRRGPVPESFFNKVAGLGQRCFLGNFVKFLRTPILAEHLWWMLLNLNSLLSSKNATKS